MSDRIEQQFVVDAAAALQTLRQLDAGFQTFENRLNSVAQAVTNFNNNIRAGGNGLTGYRQQVQATANAINRAQGAQNQLVASASGLNALSPIFGRLVDQLNNMYDRASRFGLTMETISRVALTQVLVRGFNSARDAISDATKSAAEFEKKISLVQTIAREDIVGPDGNITGQRQVSRDEIANASREIASQFNIDSLETIDGLYNSLSNQVGSFRDTLLFTAEAAKFARTTNSSLADSVDLLSSVINAYGLSAADTNRISSILFTTIDRGRVTASELGNTLGRILPSAVALGVPLEDVSAAISLISVQGLNSAETLTRVNALFSTLLKPSDDLKEVYKELGIESAELGIRQDGLSKFLEKVIAAGGKTSSELAKLAPNIRGFGGIVGVTAKGVDAFTKEIELNRKAVSDDRISQAYKLIENDAELLSRTYGNAQKVLEGFGKEIIRFTANSVRDLEKFGKAIPEGALIGFANGLGGALLSVVALQGGITVLATSMRVLNFAFLANPIVGYTALLAGLTFAATSATAALIEANAAANVEGFAKARKESDAVIKAATVEASKSFQESYSQVKSIISESLKDAGGAKGNYIASLEQIKRANTTLGDNADLALDRIIAARRGYISALAGAAKDADEIIRSSQTRVAGLREGQTDRVFNASLTGLSDASQVLKLTQRAAQISQKAADDLQKAARTGNQEQIAQALRQFERAQDVGNEAQEIAKRTGNRALEANTAKDLNNITNQQIRAEEALTAAQGKRKQQAEEERRNQELILKNLERQAKIVLENTGLFDDKGERFSQQEVNRRNSRRNAALSELISAQFSRGDFDLADVLGLAKFTEEFKFDLSKGAQSLKDQLATGDLGLTQAIDASLKEFNADPFVSRLRDAISREGGLIKPDELIDPVGLETLASEFDRILNEKLQRARSLQVNNVAISQRQSDLDAALDILDNRRAQRVDNGSGTTQLGQEFDAVGQQLREFAKDGRIADDEVVKIQSSIAQLEANVNSFKDSGGLNRLLYSGTLLTEEKALLGALETIKALREAQAIVDSNTKDGDVGTQLENIRSILEGVQKATPVTETSQVSVNLEQAVDFARQLRDFSVQAASAISQYAQSAGTLPTGGTTQNNQFGNTMLHYFNSGGLARGMDTISAMLAPGESVINARSTSRFFSQIQAMNAGIMPVFRAQQGAVTNVGDINVTVQGGGNSTQSARAIATELRRELRRGTSRL